MNTGALCWHARSKSSCTQLGSLPSTFTAGDPPDAGEEPVAAGEVPGAALVPPAAGDAPLVAGDAPVAGEAASNIWVTGVLPGPGRQLPGHISVCHMLERFIEDIASMC